MTLRAKIPTAIAYLGLFSTYIALAFLFASFSPQAQVVSLWPPAGVAMAGCLLLGIRFLPAIAIGSLIFNTGIQVVHGSTVTLPLILQSLGIGLGSTLQAYINLKLLQKLHVKILDAPSYTDVCIFIISAFICCAISAVIGNFILSGDFGSLYIWNNIFVWWIGDFFGVLLICPMILCALQAAPTESFKHYNTYKQVFIPLLVLLVSFQVAQQYVEKSLKKTAQDHFELTVQVAENQLRKQFERYLSAHHQLIQKLGVKDNTVNENILYRASETIHSQFPAMKAFALSTQDGAKITIHPFSSSLQRWLSNRNLNETLSVNQGTLSILKSYSHHLDKVILITPLFHDAQQHQLVSFAISEISTKNILLETFSSNALESIPFSVRTDYGDKIFSRGDIDNIVNQANTLSHNFTIKFTDQHWQVNMYQSQLAITLSQVKNSLGFLATEALLGTLAVFLILTIYGRKEQLQKQVDIRTKDLKELNQQLEHYAFYDLLTTLPNRRLFIEQANHSLKRATRQHEKVALLFIDLNRFKEINDSLGHKYGDELLIEVAKRFSASIRSSDFIARFGGDEFALLIEDNPNTETIENIAKKLLQSLSHPIDISSASVFTSASIGASFFPQDGHNVEDLLRGADSAMYAAKSSGGGLRFYVEKLRQRASERLFIESELPLALERKQLELYFQPIINLKSHQVIGSEALIRWNHPDYGVISPAYFISAAEQSGEIIPIGQWVFEESCRLLAKWQELGHQFNKLSLNVSVKQLLYPKLCEEFADAVRRYKVDATIIQLEITENALVNDIKTVAAVLNQLKSIGFKLAIDDYGTGYASLSYIKSLPFDVLKIDRSFVRDMHLDQHDRAIVKSTINLAQTFEMDTVAEGIENSVQENELSALGCIMGQGYLYAKPLQEAEFLDYCQARELQASPRNLSA